MKIENSESLLRYLQLKQFIIVTFWDFILQKHLNSHFKKS